MDTLLKLTMKFHFLTEEEENFQIPLPAENFVGQDGNPVFYHIKVVPGNFIKI